MSTEVLFGECGPPSGERADEYHPLAIVMVCVAEPLAGIGCALIVADVVPLTVEMSQIKPIEVLPT